MPFMIKKEDGSVETIDRNGNKMIRSSTLAPGTTTNKITLNEVKNRSFGSGSLSLTPPKDSDLYFREHLDDPEEKKEWIKKYV